MYLAGTAPQNFTGGLVILAGVFSSSTGSMSISGGMLLASGQLSGVGTIDALTTFDGNGSARRSQPRVAERHELRLVLRPETTVCVFLLDGTTAGTGYATGCKRAVPSPWAAVR